MHFGGFVCIRRKRVGSRSGRSPTCGTGSREATQRKRFDKKLESACQPVQAGLARPDTCAAGVTDAIGRDLEHFGGIQQAEMDCHRGELSSPCVSRAGKAAQSHDRMGLTQQTAARTGPFEFRPIQTALAKPEGSHLAGLPGTQPGRKAKTGEVSHTQTRRRRCGSKACTTSKTGDRACDQTHAKTIAETLRLHPGGESQHLTPECAATSQAIDRAERLNSAGAPNK